MDSNILLYAYDKLCPEHGRAYGFIQEQADNSEFVICELVLIEFYCLLRNPLVVENPLTPRDASDVCRIYRSNRNWMTVDYPGNLMNKIWSLAAESGFARRSIYDVRLALTLRHYGVTEFATRNTKHFNGFGFKRVWDPLQ